MQPRVSLQRLGLSKERPAVRSQVLGCLRPTHLSRYLLVSPRVLEALIRFLSPLLWAFRTSSCPLLSSQAVSAPAQVSPRLHGVPGRPRIPSLLLVSPWCSSSASFVCPRSTPTGLGSLRFSEAPCLVRVPSPPSSLLSSCPLCLLGSLHSSPVWLPTPPGFQPQAWSRQFLLLALLELVFIQPSFLGCGSALCLCSAHYHHLHHPPSPC